jgi:hypothetical protein
MPCRGRLLAGFIVTVSLVVAVTPTAPASGNLGGPAASRAASARSADGHETQSSVVESTAAKSRASRHVPTLSDETGLTVTIDDFSPATLTSGARVEVSGKLTNDSDHIWIDLQAYLEMSTTPATTKGQLDDFALTGDAAYGERVLDFGFFDEMGPLHPGESTTYGLSVPYRLLPPSVSGTVGVYQIGVTVLGTSGGLRDTDADARAHTLVPLVLDDSPPPQPTDVVTLVPLTAPVARQADGTFLDERLGAQVSEGGRLANLIAFTAAAPPGSLDIVLDPATLDAIQAMAEGYSVQSLAEAKADEEPRDGIAAAAAASWLATFDGVADQQDVELMPWANPDSSALAEAGMPGIVDAAVRASQRFADANGLGNTVVDWQNNGATTRRGLTAARAALVSMHVASQATLTRLPPEDDGYPPALVSINTRQGPLYTAVSRSDLAGQPLVPSISALDLRQALLAEATVRAFSSTEVPTSVVALPFHWNPGSPASSLDLAAAYASPAVRPQSLDSVNEVTAQPYAGPVEVTTKAPGFTSSQLAAMARLRSVGRVYTDLLTDGRLTAAPAFDEQSATSGSSSWQWQPKRGEALTRRTARSLSEQVRQVTVTGPEFVAMSSGSGRFPLTVANGLDVSVTVTLNVVSANPAVRFDPLQPIVLDPGERRDIEIESKASGSGVTVVKARLATATDRAFGQPWDFDIRSTRIGLAIWILMGILGAALFSGAAIRIVQRFRGGGFTPRGEAS